MISFEEFQNVELKVGRVLEAARVEGSDKLLKLMVDLGECDVAEGREAESMLGHPMSGDADVGTNIGTSDVKEGARDVRQVVAGIGKAYEPEALVGREIVVVANLEPRTFTIRHGSASLTTGSSGQVGLESHGMLLAASDENGPVLLMPEREVPPGARVK